MPAAFCSSRSNTPRPPSSSAQLAVNLRAAFLVARAFLPAMRDAGRAATSSASAAWPTTSASPRTPPTPRASTGSAGCTRRCSRSFAGTGVRLTLVSPGPVDTTIWDPFASGASPGVPAAGRDAPPDGRGGRGPLRRDSAGTRAWIGSGCSPGAGVDHKLAFRRNLTHAHSCVGHHCGLRAPSLLRTRNSRAQALPPLPDSDRAGACTCWRWRAIPRVTSGSAPTGRGSTGCATARRAWEQIRRDTTPELPSRSISCTPSAFGPRGQIWYGTVGNGWGLSLDGGTHLEELDLRPARPRVAVRDARRDRDPR